MKKWLSFLVVFSACISFVSCSSDTCYHEWSDEEGSVLVSSADCEHEAVYQRVCTKCGMKGTSFTAGGKAEHTFGNQEYKKYLVSEATCTSKAVYHQSCTRCGKMGSETFEAQGLVKHNWVKNANEDTLVGDASCTSPYTFCFTCSECGAHSEELFTMGPVFPHTDSNGDEMCDSCVKALETYYDTPIDNLTDKHDLKK